MEQVIKMLEQATAALKEWHEADKSKDERIIKQDFRIAELEAQVKAAAQAALPQVSVTGTPVGNQVEWKVETNADKPLKVKVRHTSTETGQLADYTWDVDKVAKGLYTYSGTVSPSFEILPDASYTVKGEKAVVQKKSEAQSIAVPNINFNKPFQITKGGVYENLQIESKVSSKPAIELRTAEAVTLLYPVIHNAGYGIENHNGKTNLKIIGAKAKGLPHDGSMNDPRRFLSVNNIINLEVTNCQTEHMGFLTSQGAFHGSGIQGIKVLHNHVQNVSGLKKGNRSHTNFVQLMNSGNAGIPNVQIAYNGVYNEYGQADVEDNINIYNARGRKDSRMQIHDNLIYGAYYHPSMERVKYYSGGGIITDSDKGSSVIPGHIDVFRNYIIGTGNYCLGMAAGEELKFYDNVCVVAGVLPDGRRYHDILNMHTSGLWAKDLYALGNMKGNEYRNNTVGIRHHAGRKDISDNTAAAFVGTRHLPDPITTGTEQMYVAEWELKFKDRLRVNL